MISVDINRKMDDSYDNEADFSPQWFPLPVVNLYREILTNVIVLRE